ncbi:hypothetical protein ACFL2K_00930 [Candidatus Margulisiibacteriota bacterium]
MQEKRITLRTQYQIFKKLHQISYATGISKNHLINYLIKSNLDSIKVNKKSLDHISELRNEIETCLGVTIRNYG